MKKILSLLLITEAIFSGTVKTNTIKSKVKLNSYNNYSEKIDSDIDSFVLNEYKNFNKNNDFQIRITNKKNISGFSESSYVLYEFENKGYAIFDINNIDIIEMSTNTKSPFEGYYNNLIYSPMDGYYYKDGNGIYNIKTKEYISEELIQPLEKKSKYLKSISLNRKDKNSLKSKRKNFIKNKSKDNSNSGSNTKDQYADVEVKNSWFFRENTHSFASDHSFHASGDCGYVALGLLFTYHELFSSKGYFSDEEAKAYINNVYGVNPNEKHRVPSVNKSLIKKLVECHNTATQTPIALGTITHKFMEGKNIKYKVSTPPFHTKYNIRNQIDKNNPVIVTGLLNVECGGYPKGKKDFHDVIAYGYYKDSNKYLTHYGWINCSQIILSEYAFGYVYYLENHNEHIHNNYYKYNGNEYCACGELIK